MNIGIIAFTDNGHLLKSNLMQKIDANFFVYNKGEHQLSVWLEQHFATSDAIIFIGAAAIAVRMISKLIRSKDVDPAVIVMDEHGKFIIPILSGHIGGANELTHNLCSASGGVAVITTATDINNKFAVDVWCKSRNLAVSNIDTIKHISSAILRGEMISLCSDYPIEPPDPQIIMADSGKIGICISMNKNKKPFDITLNLVPKILTIGVGCRRDTDTDIFENFVLSTLNNLGVSIKSVADIASVDLKKDENCINNFSVKYRIPFTTFTADELRGLSGEFSHSDFVEKTIGVGNVCERSAVLKGGGRLILKKVSESGMTMAVSSLDWEG